MASLWQYGPQLCQLSVGEMLGEKGHEFKEWALQELTTCAYASCVEANKGSGSGRIAVDYERVSWSCGGRR